MPEVIPVKILNFLNFGDEDDDEKQLIGLRQASGRRQKSGKYQWILKLNCIPYRFIISATVFASARNLRITC